MWINSKTSCKNKSNIIAVIGGFYDGEKEAIHIEFTEQIAGSENN